MRWTEEQYEGFSPKPKKKSKYRNVKTTVDGITFDSKKEAEYYCKLKLLKQAGEIKDFGLQPDTDTTIEIKCAKCNTIYTYRIGEKYN